MDQTKSRFCRLRAALARRPSTPPISSELSSPGRRFDTSPPRRVRRNPAGGGGATQSCLAAGDFRPVMTLTTHPAKAAKENLPHSRAYRIRRSSVVPPCPSSNLTSCVPPALHQRQSDRRQRRRRVLLSFSPITAKLLVLRLPLLLLLTLAFRKRVLLPGHNGALSEASKVRQKWNHACPARGPGHAVSCRRGRLSSGRPGNRPDHYHGLRRFRPDGFPEDEPHSP